MGAAGVEALEVDGYVTVRVERVERARSVSQLTSLSVLGIPARAYLDLAREYAAAGGVVLHVGKLRVIELDPLLAWLARRERATAAADKTDEIAAMGAELGLRAVAGGRR